MRKADTQPDLLDGSILKHIIRLAWPMVLAFAFQTSYNFIDRFFVSRLGDKATAAIGMAFIVQLVIIALGAGLGTGVNSFIARNLGAGRQNDARSTAVHTFILALSVGFVLSLLGLLLHRPLYQLLGAQPDVLEMVSRYLTIIFLFTPIVMLMMLSNNIFRGWGDTMLPMRFMVTGTLLNLILDPILIFGWGPIPPMGIGGAALATGLGRSVALLYIFGVIFVKKKPAPLSLKNFRLSWKIIRGIFQVGLPSSLSQILTSFAMGLIFFVLKPFGPNAKAAYTIVFTYEQVAFLPAIGVAQAVTILTGHNFGALKLARVKETFVKGTVVALAMLSVGTVLISLFPSVFAGVFAQSEAVLTIGHTALRITALGYIFIAFYLSSIASFQGLGLGRQYLWANLVRLYLLQIPFAFIGAHFWGLVGVWSGLLAGNVLSAVAVVAWYFYVFRVKIQTGLIRPL